MLRVLLRIVFIFVVLVYLGISYQTRLIKISSVIHKFYQMRVGFSLDRECRSKFSSGLISGGAPSNSRSESLWTLQLGLLFWSNFSKLL